jgi:DNA-binding LytR/AlgR family response regulator
MKKENIKILIIYESESEAKKIDSQLRADGFKSIVVTNNINQGIIYAGKGNADIIIAKVKINGFDVSHRLLNKRSMLGIKLLFYTFSYVEFINYKNAVFKDDNQDYLLILDPTTKNQLPTAISNFNLLNFIPKKPNYIFLKSVNRVVERISFDDILFIEAKISYCNIFCLWGMYTKSGSIAKLLNKFPENFIKVHEKYAINPLKITDLNDQDLIINQFSIPYSNKFLSTLPLGTFPKSTKIKLKKLPIFLNKKSA